MRMAWRQIFADELAQGYSWRGTQNKKCIRGSVVTLAIRSKAYFILIVSNAVLNLIHNFSAAFKQKYSLDDADFDKITQKYFQHAHDRVVKVTKKMKTVN